MAKDKLRGKSGSSTPSDSRIKSESRLLVLEDLLRFSFKFYEPNHPSFHCHDRDVDYFRKLLERIKDLSKEKVSALISAKSNSATRFHRIDFSESRVSVAGFGVRGWEEYDEDAWQFSISSNEHSRVHGFLIENVFYVVWLDPGHQLYA